MNDTILSNRPEIHPKLLKKSEEIGFSMPSDLHIGSLLKTLISSKPNGKFLELGTGIGLSLSWMLEALTQNASLVSVDNDEELIKIAKNYFGEDPRLELVSMDAAEWISTNKQKRFDLIFADAWPGKYSNIEETLDMVNLGGFYVVDDMSQQENWPEGHEVHVKNLIELLEKRSDFNITKLNWSTGLIIAVRKNTNT